MPPLETQILCKWWWYATFLFLTRQKWCWTFPCRPSSYMYVCLYFRIGQKLIHFLVSSCTHGVFSTLKLLIHLLVPLTFPPFVTQITGEIICFCGFVDHLCPLVIFHFCFRAKIRKCSFKRRRFLLKLHPEIFVSCRCCETLEPGIYEYSHRAITQLSFEIYLELL